VLIC
jgi:tRNA-dihydrouridine synthase